jgi:protein-L-isoaspartate(D-aspartate) O-methyltransferase
MRDFTVLREIMLKEHLAARGIRNPAVLSAMREVHRELFVPTDLAGFAYEDRPLPIGEGQTISQPYIVAFMTESLELARGDRVLEIGTGSGYAAAVLSRIVAEVHTVERLQDLADSARLRLSSLGYANISIHTGDGSLGWPAHAPYDAIVVTAGAPAIPKALLEQLAVGGRLVIPAGADPHFQTLIRVYRMEGNDYRQESLMGVKFVPLVGVDGWPPD